MFLGPVPRKLRLGRDHRLNDVPLAMRGRAAVRSGRPRAFQQSFKDARGSPDPLSSPFRVPPLLHIDIQAPPYPFHLRWDCPRTPPPPPDPPHMPSSLHNGVAKAELPLFFQFMDILAPSLPWIARKLSCPLELMFKRSRMFLERIFSMAEDLRLEEVLPVLLQSFIKLREDVWEGLAHLATCPIPQLTRSDPTLAAKGLGKMGSYVIHQNLWRELDPESFLRDALGYNVEAHPNGGSGTVGPRVAEMASTLMSSGVISETPLLPSYFPFIITKNSEKVSLILSCLGTNERIGDPPTFQLPSWEGIAKLLAATPRSRRLFWTHVDLTNALWSFRARGIPSSGPAGWPGLCSE